MDDGGHWKPNAGRLPAAPVSWIVVQKQTHDLVVSTYGRGIYVMEDMTPLEQGVMEPSHSEPVTLVAPRPAWRMVRGPRELLAYKLAAAPKDPVQVEIFDAKGLLVRKLASPPANAGLNRTAWDLHYDPPRMVAQPLSILLPPDSHGNESDIQSAVRLQLKVRDDISATSDMTNQLEWMRRQLEDQQKTIAGKESLVKAIAAIDQKMQAVEFQLITRAEALSDDKYFQTAYKLYMNFIWLNGEIGSGGGDVAGTADYGPTETGQALVFDLERQLAAVTVQYKGLMEKDIPSYNRSIVGSGLEPLKTDGAPPPPAHTAPFGGGEEQ
jgi:hypothetical protein